MTANETQVGGTHYKTKYEHWDMVAKYGLGYFDGQITKYVGRWRFKLGLEDLQKARHFAVKLNELNVGMHIYPVNMFLVRPWLYIPDVEVDIKNYAEVNNLIMLEYEIVLHMILGPARGPLETVISKIDTLIKNAPVLLAKPEKQQLGSMHDEVLVVAPKTDSNKHAQEDQS